MCSRPENEDIPASPPHKTVVFGSKDVAMRSNHSTKFMCQNWKQTTDKESLYPLVHVHHHQPAGNNNSKKTHYNQDECFHLILYFCVSNEGNIKNKYICVSRKSSLNATTNQPTIHPSISEISLEISVTFHTFIVLL